MLDFIVNPIAGNKGEKKIKKVLDKIKAVLKEKAVKYKIHFTEKNKKGKAVAEELIANGATDIIVTGGDGSLHEVINGFSNFENVNLGLIPCGTGNDFAAAVNIPTDVEKALDIILDGKPQYTDFMQMPTVRGINIIGMGIDVDVLKRYEQAKKKTKLTYTTSLIKTLLNFEYSDFDAEVDEEKSHHRSFIACIANGYRYGGGIPICPVADPSDGKLDFVAISEVSKLKLIGSFIKLKKGKILTLKQATHKLAERIKIITKGNYTVNVDGELYDNIPFDVKIVKNTLKMYRPVLSR